MTIGTNFKGSELLLGKDAVMVSNGKATECFLVKIGVTDKIEISTDGLNWHYLGQQWKVKK